MSDYKMVPVVATEEMFRAAQDAEKDHADFDDWMYFFGKTVNQQYSAMLAAAPKELPEEVVERVAKALYYAHEEFADGAWEREMNTKYHDHYRMLARAALLAVMGGGK